MNLINSEEKLIIFQSLQSWLNENLLWICLCIVVFFLGILLLFLIVKRKHKNKNGVEYHSNCFEADDDTPEFPENQDRLYYDDGFYVLEDITYIQKNQSE